MQNVKFAYPIFCFLLFFCVVGCQSDPPVDEEPEMKYSQIDVVTGLDLYDANGAPIGIWRKPNDKYEDITAFPVPNNGFLSVFGLENTMKILVIPASCILDSVTTDIKMKSQSLSYNVTDIEELDVASFDLDPNMESINLNLSSFSAGFYRLFYIGDSENVLWQNIYLDPAVNNFPDFSALETACP